MFNTTILQKQLQLTRYEYLKIFDGQDMSFARQFLTLTMFQCYPYLVSIN